MCNITKDSSLSTENGNHYWLSSNGIFAFGFYPIGVQYGTIQYNVGIWNHKSHKKPLVWTAGGGDHGAFSGPSSIVFSMKGNLVRISNINKISMVCCTEEEEIATSAKMHDNGNFVLYNSKGNVIWESFNYPSDTILPEQTFKSGSTLVAASKSSSGRKYKLIIDKDGNVNIRNNENDDLIVSTIYRSKFTSKCVEMKLTSNGRFILIDRNGIIIKRLNENGQLIDDELKNGMIMYRAKLDSDGYFRFYVDGISANIEKSWKIRFWNEDFILFLSILTIPAIFLMMRLILKIYGL